MRVAVIGGGISGLYTIYKLVHHHKLKLSDFKLYEGSDNLGGRIKTLYTKGGIPIELGAGRFSIESHPTLNKLINNFLISCTNFNYNKITDFSQNGILSNNSSVDNELVIKLLTECKANQLLKSPSLNLNSISFKDWILDYSSLKAFNILEQVCGYAVINNKLLPADEGLKILDQHPEAHGKFLSHNMEFSWKQPKDGFIQLVKAITNSIKDMPNIQIFTGHNVKKINKKNKSYELCIENKVTGDCLIEADMVFLTIPANYINKLELVAGLSNIKQIYKEIVQVPLFKMFLHFPKNWWCKYIKTKENFFIVNTGPERKFYFSNHKNEIMIYSDSGDAVLLNEKCSNHKETFLPQLYKKIANFFGLSELPYSPTDINYQFWESGVSFWKINTQRDRLLSIRKEHAVNNFYIVSDMITESSGWINSTLDFIDDLTNNV